MTSKPKLKFYHTAADFKQINNDLLYQLEKADRSGLFGRPPRHNVNISELERKATEARKIQLKAINGIKRVMQKT